MDSCSTSLCIVSMLALSHYFASAELILKPKDTESKRGALIFLNCSTSNTAEEIFWFHYNIGSKERKLVYGYSQFYPPYQGRIQVEKKEEAGQFAYNLLISSVNSQDSGIYECQEDAGQGEQSPQAQMIVLESDPICQSDMKPEGVIGPNSCGLSPEDLHLTCRVKFYGNRAPVMSWFKGHSSQPITQGVTSSVSGDVVTYNLTVEADSSIDGSSFECRTTRSPTVQFQCASVVVTVVGSKTLTIAVICLACALPLAFILGCCVSGCSIKKNRRVETQAEAAEYIPLTERTETNRINEELKAENEALKDELTRYEQLIYSNEKKNNSKEAKFIQKIETKSESVITGITLMCNQLYVVHEGCSSIEVYDSLTFNFERNLSFETLTHPSDIASSESSGCLFVADIKCQSHVKEKIPVSELFALEAKSQEDNRYHQNDQSQNSQEGVYQNVQKEEPDEVNRAQSSEGGAQTSPAQCYLKTLDSNGKLLHHRVIKDVQCRLSAFGRNVIVCLFNRRELMEFSPKGTTLCVVKLSPSDGFHQLFHAIKVTRSDFVVAHTTPDLKHRLSIVGADGKVKLSSVEKLNAPTCLVEDSFKSVLVADSGNGKILLFNSTLDKCEELNLKEQTSKMLSNLGSKKDRPLRITLDEQNGRLFIVLQKGDKNANGGISIFNVMYK